MREKLIQYVELLFAGAPVHDEVRQEILQNTLDRYDDLVEQGKSPEAAYQLAIRGIGDITEIQEDRRPAVTLAEKHAAPKQSEEKRRKVIQAIAVGLYILCPLPVLILQSEVGVCLLLAVVAAATIILVATGRDEPEKEPTPEDNTPLGKLKKCINSILWTAGTCVYFILSFLTGAWYITWILFPITAAVKELILAVMDFKEAQNHEK